MDIESVSYNPATMDRFDYAEKEFERHADPAYYPAYINHIIYVIDCERMQSEAYQDEVCMHVCLIID